MIDIIKESMNLLLADSGMMKLLNNNRSAVCRIRAPDAGIKPRIEFLLLDDGDGDFYDGRPTTYNADIRITVYKGDSLLFDIGNRVNDILTGCGFERMQHTDGYDYNADLYLKQLAYRCKIKIEGDDFQWLKQ